MQAAADARRSKKKRCEEAAAQDDQDGAATSVGAGSVGGASGKGFTQDGRQKRKATFGALEGAPGDAHVVVTASRQGPAVSAVVWCG
jgi:hypothetical protein